MALQDKQPPKEETSPKAESKPTRTRTTPRKGSDLDKIRKRLTELCDTLASGQQMMGVALQDPRPFLGGKVTEGFTPTLVEAWVNLAEESPAVKRYLLAMAEGSAWGEVAFATIGFSYTMGQAYGAIPFDLSNPWMDITEIVPPAGAPAGDPSDPRTNGRKVPVTPDAEQAETTTDTDSGMSQAEAAQAEAERIAERRKNRKGPIVET